MSHLLIGDWAHSLLSSAEFFPLSVVSVIEDYSFHDLSFLARNTRWGTCSITNSNTWRADRVKQGGVARERERGVGHNRREREETDERL